MRGNGNLYVLGCFKLLYITIIFFCFLILSLLVCDFWEDGIFLQLEIPAMCISVLSSTLILSVELIAYYIDLPNKLKKGR